MRMGRGSYQSAATTLFHTDNFVNLPPNYQDVVLDVKVLYCELQAGHSSKTPLLEQEQAQL